MLTCVQIHFKGPAREIGRLLSNMISNVKLKLEISKVKAGLKKYTIFFKKVFIVSFRLNRIRHKTSAVNFRAFCIASQKVLLLPSLHKLFIVWLGLDI